METLDREYIKTWVWRLAVLTALLVGGLSWLGRVQPSFLVVRMGLAFAVIYGLGMGGLVLFDKGGIAESSSTDQEKGSLIDIAIGEQAEGSNEDGLFEGSSLVGGVPGTGWPEGGVPSEEGYREAGSAKANPGMASEESLAQQPDLGRPGGLPGQVKPGLQRGLPDSETQAEMVRRMGWENLSDS